MDRGPGVSSWSDYLAVWDPGESNLAHRRKPIRNRFASMAVYPVGRATKRGLVIPKLHLSFTSFRNTHSTLRNRPLQCPKFNFPNLPF